MKKLLSAGVLAVLSFAGAGRAAEAGEAPQAGPVKNGEGEVLAKKTCSRCGSWFCSGCHPRPPAVTGVRG